MEEQTLQQFLCLNDALFNHLMVFNQSFEIIPDKKHFGVAINYIDLQEYRDTFLRELINTIVDWVFSHSKQEGIVGVLRAQGRTISNQYSELRTRSFDKFRITEDGKLLHGQFGELLLFVFLQKFFHAVPLLRKMPITTSTMHERYGADAIHFKLKNEKKIFYLGEAKSYTSNYQFNTAMEESIISILNTYNNHRNEINSYLYENFLEPELEKIAQDYINGVTENAEVHLVSVITFNEKSQVKLVSEVEIKNRIKSIIEYRYKNFDKNKIDIKNNPILKRITYIAFPIWEFEQLIEEFASKLHA